MWFREIFSRRSIKRRITGSTARYNGHGGYRSAIESMGATCQRAHSNTLRRWLAKVDAGRLGSGWRKPITVTLMLRGEA